MPRSKFLTDQARPHHYLFAHRVLPAEAQEYGPAMLEVAAESGLTEALGQIWESVGRRLPEEQQLPADGLEGSFHELPAGQVALVRFPPVEHMLEAYLAAIVVPRNAGPVRYYVLEHSWTVSDEPETMLAEWDGDKHRNLGFGPAPEVVAFLQAVQAQLD